MLSLDSPRPFASAWFRWGPVAVLGVIVLVLLVWVVRPVRVGTERFEPVQVAVSDADPLVLEVEVRWPYDGFCPGEVRAVVREQRDRVVVRRVERLPPGTAGCAGVGTTPGSLVSGAAKLQQPLGRRLVVTGDGRRLPVVPVGS